MNRSITHRGMTFKSASHRRFVTYVVHPDSKPLVVKRTDNVHTARQNHSIVQRRFMGSKVFTLDMAGERVYQPGYTVASGLAWIKPEADAA